MTWHGTIIHASEDIALEFEPEDEAVDADIEEEESRTRRKKKKEKPLKGVTHFGAGLEKGLPTEERNLKESERKGRTKRRDRSELRSASKGTFRQMNS